MFSPIPQTAATPPKKFALALENTTMTTFSTALGDCSRLDILLGFSQIEVASSNEMPGGIISQLQKNAESGYAWVASAPRAEKIDGFFVEPVYLGLSYQADPQDSFESPKLDFQSSGFHFYTENSVSSENLKSASDFIKRVCTLPVNPARLAEYAQYLSRMLPITHFVLPEKTFEGAYRGIFPLDIEGLFFLSCMQSFLISRCNLRVPTSSSEVWTPETWRQLKNFVLKQADLRKVEIRQALEDSRASAAQPKETEIV